MVHASRRAFTLVELLVVVAIIGLLIGMIVPSARAIQRESQNAGCLSNLRQGFIAIVPSAHRYWLPPGPPWTFAWFAVAHRQLLERLKTHAGVFTCTGGSALANRHAELVEEERQHVRLLRDLLGQGCAHAVSRGRAEPSEHGVPRAGGGLQRCIGAGRR